MDREKLSYVFAKTQAALAVLSSIWSGQFTEEVRDLVDKERIDSICEELHRVNNDLAEKLVGKHNLQSRDCR